MLQLQSLALLPLGAMFQEKIPRQWDQRGLFKGSIGSPILLFMWVLAVLPLMQAYHGNLKAATITKTYEKPILVLEEMVQRYAPW